MIRRDKHDCARSQDLSRRLNFLEQLFHQSPSVGSVIKKIIAINSELNTLQMIDIIRQCIQTQATENGVFASAEVIDEEKALRLAKAIRI